MDVQKLVDRLSFGTPRTIDVSVFIKGEIDYSTVGGWEEQTTQLRMDFESVTERAYREGGKARYDEARAAWLRYTKVIGRPNDVRFPTWKVDKLIDRRQLPEQSSSLLITDFLAGIDYRPLGTQLEQMVQMQFDLQAVSRDANDHAVTLVPQVDIAQQCYIECIRRNYENLSAVNVPVIRED